jgi:dsDNA-specific endonuclease/ATPase MutS2
MLTGANRGGKTTLLLTIAVIHIMTILGLPVPADEAEVPLLPLYLFRRRTTRKAGSLEHAVHSLAPVFADPEPKVLLIDEFEALTEPISAGRMVASIVNRISLSNCLTVFVTHLAREALPYVKVKIRVDGIEASGVDVNGELIVERQPRFNHVGTSTPELVIRRLHMKTRNRRVRALYVEMMDALGERGQVVQTPISLPWVERAKNRR